MLEIKSRTRLAGNTRILVHAIVDAIGLACLLFAAFGGRAEAAGVSFASPANYTVGEVPSAVGIGDFNGDGNPDLAVANTVSDDVSILLGNGDGTFQAATGYGVGSGPGSIAVGDFNGDGRVDLVVGNFNGGTLSILLGNGDGTFQPAQSLTLVGSPAVVVAGDFNGDGKTDLAVALSGVHQLMILLGDGQGNFQTFASYSLSADPTSLLATGLNGDAYQDLAVAAGRNVEILLGNGDGTFRQAESLPPTTGDTAISVAAGDFNLDGKLDLIVSSRTTCIALLCPLNIELFVGNDDGTFLGPSPVAELKAYSGSGSLAIADFNRDLNPDVAIDFYDSQGNIAIATGNGDGTFQPPVTLSFGLHPISPVAADLNHDGVPDLVLPDAGSANGQTYSVSVLMNNTTIRSFTLFVTINGSGTGGVGVRPGFHLCGHSCTVGFISGTRIQVGEIPSSGSTFAGWSGACSGTSNTCSLVMDSNKFVTVSFNVRPDFSLTPSTLSPAVVTAGQSATGTVTVNPGGGFNNTLTFSCFVQPSPSHAPTCAVNPSSSGASVMVMTTAPSFAARDSRPASCFFAFWLPLIGFVTISLRLNRRGKNNGGALLVCALLLSGITFQSACGGPQVKQVSGGTPPGNYTITVTCTSAALQHTTSFALTVQ